MTLEVPEPESKVSVGKQGENIEPVKHPDSKVSVQQQEPATSYGFGWRHIVTLLAFFGFIVLYSLRVNLSVGLVAMLNHTALKGNASAKSSICERVNETLARKEDGPFIWKTEMQGLILGSFFWGYILTQIPGGFLAGRYGAKAIFGFGIGSSAVLTLMHPAAAEIGSGALITLRILEGLGAGVTWPAVQSLFSRWAPPSERSVLPAFAYAGCFIGTPLTFALSGVMIDAGLMGGWPSVFYIFGILGCVWLLLWIILGSSSPEEHRFISVAERTYIVNSLEKERAGRMAKPGFRDVPWKEIVKSTAVWSVVVSQFSYAWALYVLLTGLPTYFNNVLGFNIRNNGLLSALPYVFQATVYALAGFVTDMMRSKCGFQTVTVRKIFDCLGRILPAIFFIAVDYVECDIKAAVACLVLSVACSGFCSAGYTMNFLDIAPQFASILFGISNTIAATAGFIAPYTTGVITKRNTLEAWRIVFFVVGITYAVSVVMFAVFGKGTLQPWAEPKKPPSNETKT